jgi:hypothetical protein
MSSARKNIFLNILIVPLVRKTDDPEQVFWGRLVTKN